MSTDSQLDLLKRKRLLEMRRHLLEQQAKEKAKADEKTSKEQKETVDPETILKSIFIGRGWEVWEAARRQHPKTSGEVGRAIVTAHQSGRLKEKISGEQLFWLFQRIGLRIRLETHIRILESGEAKSIAQKLKEG